MDLEVLATPEGRITSKKIGLKVKLVPRPHVMKKRVTSVAPAKSRCTVENRGKSDQPSASVELCHVFGRKYSIQGELMTSIEYYWGMERGSLNLDSRSNCFYGGCDLHTLYDKGMWCLLPTLDILKRYSEATKEDNDEFGVRLSQAMKTDELPLDDPSSNFHSYTLLALSPEMGERDIYIYPTDRTKGRKAYASPFDDPFLTIKSHILPRFVILSLGSHLTHSTRIPSHFREQKHVQMFSKELALVEKMYRRWTQKLTRKQELDPEFPSLDIFKTPALKGSNDHQSYRAASSKSSTRGEGSVDVRRSDRIRKGEEGKSEERRKIVASSSARSAQSVRTTGTEKRRIGVKVYEVELDDDEGDENSDGDGDTSDGDRGEESEAGSEGEGGDETDSERDSEGDADADGKTDSEDEGGKLKRPANFSEGSRSPSPSSNTRSYSKKIRR